MIFDAVARTECQPARFEESTFVFMNRVAGDYWSHPRDLVQTWADHLHDDGDYADLRSRLRSGDDYQFRSAFLELYLHEVLVRTGHKVTVHPATPTSRRRPDFYAERDGQGFYLEAIAPGASPARQAAANRRNRLLDIVNDLPNPNFTLMLDELEEGPASPPSVTFRKKIASWLNSLDPGDYPSFDSAPSQTFEEGSWSMTLRALPRPAEGRCVDSGERAIGVYAHTPAAFVDDVPMIHKALKTKTSAYGDLDAPYVIAVGTYLFGSDREQFENAMYGTQVIQSYKSRDARLVRLRDGYFGAPHSWTRSHVSGVLFVNQLMPYRPHHAEPTLWLHPAPHRPFTQRDVFPGALVEFDGQTLTTAPSDAIATMLFGLDSQWPPGEAWPRTSGREA